MKNSGKNMMKLTMIILILVIAILIGIIIKISSANNVINKQESNVGQQLETTSENAYVSMETHLAELNNKQKEIDNMQSTAGQANVTADKILKNYTAYKDGKLITGTMEDRGTLNWNPNNSTTYTVPAGYYSGGTLSSANAYDAGYTNGVNSIKNILETAAPYGIPTIPVMTSTTAPSGNITSYNLKNGYNNTVNCFNETGIYCYAGINGYIQYQFESNVQISTIGFNISNYYGGGQTYYFSVSASSDGTDYTTLYSSSYTASKRVYIELEQPVTLKYIKFTCTNGSDSNHGCGFADIQCYKDYGI